VAVESGVQAGTEGVDPTYAPSDRRCGGSSASSRCFSSGSDGLRNRKGTNDTAGATTKGLRVQVTMLSDKKKGEGKQLAASTQIGPHWTRRQAAHSTIATATFALAVSAFVGRRGDHHAPAAADFVVVGPVVLVGLAALPLFCRRPRGLEVAAGMRDRNDKEKKEEEEGGGAGESRGRGGGKGGPSATASGDDGYCRRPSKKKQKRRGRSADDILHSKYEERGRDTP
jgi:hypothetical protein